MFVSCINLVIDHKHSSFGAWLLLLYGTYLIGSKKTSIILERLMYHTICLYVVWIILNHFIYEIGLVLYHSIHKEVYLVWANENL